jgi:hypothetical protein
MSRRWRTVASLLFIALLAGLMATGTAHASVPAYLPGWVITGSEYQQFQAAGYAGPPPQYVLCEPPGTGPDNAADVPAVDGVCTGGQAIAFSSETVFAAWLKGGGRGSALFDPEGWSYTPPAERSLPGMEAALCTAAKLARADGVRLIEAPVGATASMLALDEEAVRCGAYGVGLQDQASDRVPVDYEARTVPLVKALRKIRKDVTIIGGLATNPGGYPVPASDMYYSWLRTKSLLNGYWLNMAAWDDPLACVPAVAGNTDDTGCLLTGLQFMERAGYAGAAP